MDFWSEFSKTITNAADQTVKSTEKLTNIAKLKYRLGALTNKQNECFQNIGRLRYAEFSGETVTSDMYENLFAEAASLDAQKKECENTKGYELLSEMRSPPSKHQRILIQERPISYHDRTQL